MTGCTNTHGYDISESKPKDINVQRGLRIKVTFSCEVRDLWSNQCPGKWEAIGHAVVYYTRAVLVFSAGTKCRHCSEQGVPLSRFDPGQFHLSHSSLRHLSVMAHGEQLFRDAIKTARPWGSRPFQQNLDLEFR